MKTRKIDRIRGAAMIEYVLITALIAVVSIGQLTAFGTSISQLFNELSNKIDESL